MRHRARMARLAALAVALTVHAALALSLMPGQEVRIEGGHGAAQVRLGSAFADMVAGTVTAARPETMAQPAPETPDMLRPAQPRAAQAARAAPVTAARARADLAIRPAQVAAIRATPAQALSEAAAPQSVQATTAEAQAAHTTPERIAGATPDSAAALRSLRPEPRSARAMAAHREAMARPSASAQGNATTNASAGQASGASGATARQSGTDGQQQAAGTTAASNYPGLVMRKLSRAGRPRTAARGTAIVAFSIAASGAVEAVSLSRSSGSAALDSAAVGLVRGAGPFPKPPAGARRSFSVRIDGR